MSGRVIYEWAKRGGAFVRVTIAEYNGSRFLDIREWVEREGESPLATRKGVTMPLEALAGLHDSVGTELMENAAHASANAPAGRNYVDKGRKGPWDDRFPLLRRS